MKCPRCQHIIVEGSAKFCSECGQSLSLQQGDNSGKPLQSPVESDRQQKMESQPSSVKTEQLTTPKRPNEEPEGSSLRKKKKKKKSKKKAKEKREPVSLRSDQVTSELSETLSELKVKTNEEGAESSDSEGEITTIDDSSDLLDSSGTFSSFENEGKVFQGHNAAALLNQGGAQQSTSSKKDKKEQENSKQAEMEQCVNVGKETEQQIETHQQSETLNTESQQMVFGPQSTQQAGNKNSRQKRSRDTDALKVEQSTNEAGDSKSEALVSPAFLEGSSETQLSAGDHLMQSREEISDPQPSNKNSYKAALTGSSPDAKLKADKPTDKINEASHAKKTKSESGKDKNATAKSKHAGSEQSLNLSKETGEDPKQRREDLKSEKPQMLFGPQSKPQTRTKASSQDTKVDVEKMQVQKSANESEGSPSKPQPRNERGGSSNAKDHENPVQKMSRVSTGDPAIPPGEKMTIYFHAILSKDFKLDPNVDRVFLRAGSHIGSWKENAVELFVSSDLGEHGFYIEGKIETTKSAATESIPYKYVVYKASKNKEEYEYIYKEATKPGNHVNRCLFVKTHLLSKEGEWHQYDDIICAPPSKGIVKRIKEGLMFWTDQHKTTVQGRDIAGNVMLETIFDLLRSWSDINLTSFVSQLTQFLEVYGSPTVYEDVARKWHSLEYDQKEVHKLLKGFLKQRVLSQPQKDDEEVKIFIPDRVKAAMISVWVFKKYSIRLDNKELSHLCSLLCLPKLKKEEFLQYWEDFVKCFSPLKDLPEMVVQLLRDVKDAKMSKWVWLLPLVHFLRGHSKPFEPISHTAHKTDPTWAGLHGLKLGTFTIQDRSALLNTMKANTHLVEVDCLLARTWISLVALDDLVKYCTVIPVGLLDVLSAFSLKMPSEISYGNFSEVLETLSYVQKNLIEHQYSCHDEEYGSECLVIAVKLLEKTCRTINVVHMENFTAVPLTCINLMVHVLHFCSGQDREDVILSTRNAQLLSDAMKIMRNWISQSFRKKLLNVGYMSVSLTSEIEMWDSVLSLRFCNEAFTEEWKQAFIIDFEGKFKKETQINQIKVYCSQIEELNRTHPQVAKCIENCALQAVSNICQTRSGQQLFDEVKDLGKFGKLVSTIIEKSWPRDTSQNFLEGDELVFQHLLNWTIAKNIFQLHGADQKLIDELSEEARCRISVAASAFASILDQFIGGTIRISLLNHILHKKAAFMELLTIDSLSLDKGWNNTSIVRRLLKWREDEVKAVYHERELVESLLFMCRKLQDHIKISMDDLEERHQANIEIMALNEFLDVHLLDGLNYSIDREVTFFNLDQDTRQKAEILHSFKESFVFQMTWENQAKDLLRNYAEEDSVESFSDEEEDEMFTPEMILEKIFEPCYTTYTMIYKSLKDGSITLKEVEAIFEAFKGKYEDLGKDLELMCKIEFSDNKSWVWTRIHQIQQYHELHLAVETAQVIWDVKQTLCLQGDFHVLETLREAADENFKEESLDRIDSDLMQAKRIVVDITDCRRQCLQELCMRKTFVVWVKEALEDINELKVFVDLASISAGENDLDVDRVACFHDAVLGYSSMLYELKPESSFQSFSEALKKLWKAFDNDCNLPKKLRDSARHLEWLKTVKDSHGSVELSSLSLASAINKKGIYIISAQNFKKLCLETCLKLKITESHEDGQEMRSYSLEDLRELQNKLMLMSGKGEQGQCEVDNFVEVFAGVQRLAEAYIELFTAGNPLFRLWEANINCNPESKASIIMDFNLTNMSEIMVGGNLMEQLPELCRKMEKCQSFWKDFMDRQRSQYYFLNYYTSEQIVYLCSNLTQKNVNDKLDEQVLMMTSFIKPGCTVYNLRQAWHQLRYETLNTALQNEELDLQTFHEGTASMEIGTHFKDDHSIELDSDVEQCTGSRKFDAVWNSFMTDITNFLPDSLDVRYLGRLLEILANDKLFAEDMDEDEDDSVGLTEGKRRLSVCRQMPKGMSSGKPNLIVCPNSEILTSCICIYMNSVNEQLPTYDEVLLCTANTPYEQVELFLRRCLTVGYRGQKIYTMLYADQLSYEVSYRVEQLFQNLKIQCQPDYRLVIICSADREHAYLPSAFSQFRLPIVPLESLEKIQHYLSTHYTVPSNVSSAAAVFRDRLFAGIVSSNRAGVGKSLYIQRLYETLNMCPEEKTNLKCIRLIEPKVDETAILHSLLNQPSGELTIFHFDITTSVQKGLNEFLFKLLFLHYLMDCEGHVWKCSNRHLYVVEILQPTGSLPKNVPRQNVNSHFPFLDVFPKVFCRSPKEVLEIEVRMKEGHQMDEFQDPLMDDLEFTSDAYQRPYQYLKRFHNGECLDGFKYSCVDGTHVECLQMFFLYCGIIDPSWAELRNFAWFLNLQLLDCETSVFCDVTFTGDTLQGFKNFVVDFMILMAKDFATPSLSISDQSPGRQHVDLTGVNEEDLAPFRIRKRWEVEPHPYIFFNDDHISMTFIGFHLQVNEHDGVDAIHPYNRTVIKRNIMSRQLYEGLQLQRVPFNIDFDKLRRDEKIQRLCNVLGIEWPLDPDETYELTTDNILKMLAIHMRFRCGIPVIIMGETGCGKTRLIKFLCELRRIGVNTENMKLVKVHGGTNSEMIYSKVREAETIAEINKQNYSFNSVLFFDEANTTEAISSIKEVLCDNTVQGERLSPHTGLQVIAACNPYRRHTDEMIHRLESAGLGYRVRAEDTEDKLGSIPLRQLVYRVQALPPSMIPLVWDFGQLNDHTEKMYIQQVVERVVKTSSISPRFIDVITNVLSSSQKYMRTRKDECSFVSLRDVERCMQAFMWFYNNSTMLLDEVEMFLDKSQKARNQNLVDDRDPVLWSLIMAVGVCYHACLENKDVYRKEICKSLQTYTPNKVQQEISLMQDVLLSGVPLGNTIAKNSALKENVFMMVICIELRIPLFLVGKPGSSKSLSKTLVADAMQGQAAHSDLYKKLKQVHLVSFQCSPHSTPEGIIATFKQCARFQEGKNLKEYISVVVLDEIGLAEDSIKMPLKTLHPLLEEGCIDDEPLPHKKVGFIGISNWALDPAKMNRGIFVSRGDPDQRELIESAKGICASDEMILEKVRDLFKPFASAYLDICKEKTGFFGLRDFYSLIKMMFSVTKTKKQKPTAEQIMEAVLRNFSGRDDVDVVKVFTENLHISLNLEKVSKIDLVRHNISSIGQDDDCRYLLLLTKNYAALQILQQMLFSDNLQPEIIFGSSFPKDQEYTQICRNINRVKICMETGQTIVLLNLQNLYESLYDALNQYYVCLGGQKYVDLGLGTHRVKCRVHGDFRLIVIEEKEVVYKQFPIPLINRLEKHYVDINSVLKRDQILVVKELEKWVESFVALKGQNFMATQTYEYVPPDVFIGYHSDTCASVVLQVTERFRAKSEETNFQRKVFEEARLILLACATPDSVVRLDCTQLSTAETEELTRIYFEKQKHNSLVEFILSRMQLEEWSHVFFTEVTTFSRLLTASDIEPLHHSVCSVQLLSLQQFDTEQSFLKKIRNFFESVGKNKVLIIQTEFEEGTFITNLIASAKYSAMNEINKLRDEEMKEKVFVYFITKLPRMEGGSSYVGFHGGPWKSVHIDDLRKSKDIVSDIKTLRSLTISQLFEERMLQPMEVENMDGEDVQPATEEHLDWDTILDTTALVRSCVQSAVGMLRDQTKDGARSTKRIEILLTLLNDSEDVKAAFLKSVKRRLHSLLLMHDENTHCAKNWVFREASNIDALQEGGTFRHTLWKRVQSVVTPFLAQLISVVDRDCNLDLLVDSHAETPVKRLWLDIFGNEKLLHIPYNANDGNSDSRTILVQSSMLSDNILGCTMPFSWKIRDFMDELLVHSLSHEGQNLTQFEEFFGKTPLGRYIAATGIEMQQEFFHRYLQDFVLMTLRVTSEVELQLYCAALASSVNELRARCEPEDTVLASLTWVHIAYQEFKVRLQNFCRMLTIEPRAANILQNNNHALGGAELILDVYAAIACVELLEPQTLSTDVQCLGWLRQVKRLQVPIELLCSEESLGCFGERSHQLLNSVRNGWNRILSLSLFVEHMVLGIEQVDIKLKPLVLMHTRRLGQVLEADSDLKKERPFEAVIDILKACKDGANEKIFKFGFQPCPVCLGDPQQPLSLPCNHIYCLPCIKTWLTPGQMYCPLCMQEVADDFELKEAEDIRFLISLYTQFRKQCNAFFIDLVTRGCFRDNTPPSKTIILHLLSFLMVAENVVPTIKGQRNRILTKALSPFDDSIDKNPVVRSVVLKLLLKYSFDKVKSYLQRHLSEVENSNILEERDKMELYSLYINCLEDSMFEQMQCHTMRERLACLRNEAFFLQAFLNDSSVSVTVEYLQHIARIRFCLDIAAHLLVDQLTGSANERAEDTIPSFLKSVADLCGKSGNDWYRVYLIRKVCSKQGVEFVQKLLTVADVQWLFPEEILQQSEEGGQIDQYLMYGENYKTIRDALAKAVIETKLEGIDELCESCGIHPAKRTLFLLLAMFREVTSLYRSANPGFHPKPEQCEALDKFIQNSKVLNRPEEKAFATNLVYNRLGCLSIRADTPGGEHAVIEVVIHLGAVLSCGNNGVPTPLKQLAQYPSNMQNAFLPTMPEDMLAMARHALGNLYWYNCPKGHPCTVGECGQPMELARCLECGEQVGGQNHRPVTGFTMTNNQDDRTQKGHVLGDPTRRDNPDMLDTRNMSLGPFTLVRLLTHMAMLLGTSCKPQDIGQIIKPPVMDPGAFLMAHLLKDMEQLTRTLGKGADETISTVNLMLSSLMEPCQASQWPVRYDDCLSSKEARNAWESAIATDIITPQLKYLERQLKEVSAFIRRDSRILANPIMKVVFGDPRLFLTTLPRDNLIHGPVVWSCRERVTLLSLSHIVEQNDGKDTMPVLWKFLQKEAELRLVKFLPDILALQKSLIKIFQNQSDLGCLTIEDFLKTRRAASLMAWYETKIKIFLTTWSQLRSSLATNGELKIPAELCHEDLNLQSDVQVLLPRRQGVGLCSTALVSYLISLHNELIRVVDKHTGEDTSYIISPADLTDLHVIRYELERDLIPLVLSNCQYSMERGQETVQEYDLLKIQQQILTRFLQGKPFISLTGLPTLVKKQDRNYENILKDVKVKIAQESMTSLMLVGLVGELLSYSDICEALSVLEMALGFLAVTSGEPQLQLKRYLEETLKMGDQTSPHILQALSRCSLKHCVALWQFLTSLKSEAMLSLKRDPFAAIPAEYKKPLSNEQCLLLQGFLTKGSMDLWLMESHELLILILKNPCAPDTYRPNWGLRDTLVSYMERKDLDIPPELEEFFPEEICLSEFVEAWKFAVAFKRERSQR